MRAFPVPALALGLAAGCGGGSSGAPPAPCGTATAAPGTSCVARVEGSVVDFAGAAVPKASVSMCSRSCYGAEGAADGTFSIAIGNYIDPTDYALHVSGRPDFADVYTKVGAPSGTTITFAPVRVPRLPASGPALPPDKGPASSVESGDLRLDVPEGVTIAIDVADVELGALGRELRVASVGLDQMPDFAEPLAGVVALYALAPPSATSSAPLGVHLKNTGGLPALAAVELYVLDDDYRPIPPTAGSARLAATAHVSADGASIDSDPGQGIANLTWIVVRKK